MTQPWGNAIDPLTLGDNNDLPRASRNNFPRLNGDGSTSIEQDLGDFHKACGVINPQHEDVAVRIFVDALVDNATNWFQDLPT